MKKESKVCSRALRVLLVATAALPACATTARNKTLQLMGASAAAGAIYGASRQEFKSENALLYGAGAAAVAGVVGLYMFNDTKQVDDLERKLQALEKQFAPVLVTEGNSALSAPLPKDISKLVKPGSWRRYKLDQWVQDEANPNVWYRQREMFELVPPQTAN